MKNIIIEPVFYDDIVFSNDNIFIKKICFWEKCKLYHFDDNLLQLEMQIKKKEIKTFIFTDGTRATEMEFNYIGEFCDGLAMVDIIDKGYGYIDKNLNLIIPPKYAEVNEFSNGVAVVALEREETIDGNRIFISSKKWIFLDKNGKEHAFYRSNPLEPNYEYKAVTNNVEGMFRVSYLGEIKLKYADFENDDNAGLWGYADINGKEIIEPQYIYAFDFYNGLALVCRGEWDKEWVHKGKGYKYEQYWAKYEYWGMIDKMGKEMVPCVFEDLAFFPLCEETKYLKAKKEGKWGIINYFGEWIVDPAFEDIGCDIYNENIFVFFNISSDNYELEDDIRKGLYSIEEQKIIFEPQFLDIDFLYDGIIAVTIFDEKLGRNIVKIINYDGKEIIDSQYSWICKHDDLYLVNIDNEDDNDYYGLVDRNWNVLVPCKYKTFHGDFLLEQKLIICEENGKLGLRNFDDRVILKHEYTSIEYVNDNIIIVETGGKLDWISDGNNNGKYGIININGEVLLPIEYDYIDVYNDLIIAKDDKGSMIFRVFYKGIK